MKTWPMKITAISQELGQARVFIGPISPKIAEKRRRGKGSESEKKIALFKVFKINKKYISHLCSVHVDLREDGYLGLFLPYTMLFMIT